MGQSSDHEARSGRSPQDVSIDDPPSTDDAPAGPVGDLIRRLTAVGLSGFFNTEGAIRRAFGDKVPQEWVDFVADQSDRGRQELFDRVATEFGRVLEGMDVEELIEDLVTDRTIEIEAKIRIRPRENERESKPDPRGERTRRAKPRKDEPAS